MAVGSATSFYSSGTFYKRAVKPTGLYTSGSIYKKSLRSGGYTPGSLYNRFEPSYAQTMNRKALRSQISTVISGVSSIYNSNYSLWEGLSTLAAQEAHDGIKAKITEKIDKATKSTGSVLDLKA